ncbi:MAG: response regulator [Bdellovibrionota bacterium]
MSTLPSHLSSSRDDDYYFTPQFLSVVESLNEGVLIADPDGFTIFVNSRMADLTGFSKEEILGRRVYEVFFPAGSAEQEREAARMEARYQARKQGIAENYELQITRKDGKQAFLEIKAGPLFDRDGKISGSIGAISDVTQARHLQDQLRWSQKMEAVGRLAGGVAHDFNNLLTVIQGYADLLRQELDPCDPHTRKVDVIREASEAASTLTQQLLTISRRQVVQMRPINLNDVIEKSLRVVQGLLGERVKLIVDLSTDVPLVRGDAGQIQQILLNLTVNARDAMPDGGTLLIESTTVDKSGAILEHGLPSPDGRFVRLRVEDTGQGMDEEVKAHLFEPFFTTKRNGLGSGLGLSVTFGIVEEHNAEIRVSSEPGQGATFDISFPAMETPVSELSRLPEWHGLTGAETILVVEDHIAVRVLLRETLQRYGYQVLEADDGREALDLLQRQDVPPIDLLITDLIMPRVNGIELATTMRDFNSELAIILISGYADDPLIGQKTRELGYTFLPKPFSPEVLAQAVRAAIDKKRAARVTV